MNRLTEKEILKLLSQGETFEGVLEDHSLEIQVKEYVPYLCNAGHAGHELREELANICLLTPEERKREEDYYTGELISSFPITLKVLDSRYEYDVNKSKTECIYEVAWGQKVWGRPLTETERTKSLEKWSRYYRIFTALTGAVKKKFGNCLVIDVHSFNWQIRDNSSAPVFNLGTSQIRERRWPGLLNVFEEKLKEIRLPNINTTVQRNTVYQGLGHQARYTFDKLTKTTIIPLDIKKIYMDELSGDTYPLVVESLRSGLYHAVLATAAQFSKRLENVNIRKADLLPADLDPIVLKVDKELANLAGQIDTLQYVNPVNMQYEKKRFLNHRNYEPVFHYRQLRTDPYEFREKLYKLPVSQIADPPLRELYRNVVDSFATKVEMLTHIGTPSFLYNSLRYYGEPTSLDISNARFLLHAAKPADEAEEEPNIGAEEIKATCEKAAKDFGIECDVVLSSKIVANAMVDGARRTLRVHKNAKVTPLELRSLIYHELGVHMATTIHARNQPLKVFILGLPHNTYTQEGLAIFWEYISDSLNLDRLRQLALRVLAVEMMIKGMSFSTVFHVLNNDYGLLANAAFTLTTRVFRGGGFTKDYLYLAGFRDIVRLARQRDISPLLTGKVSAPYLQTLDELIERKIVEPPTHLSAYRKGLASSKSETLNYLVSCIK